MPRQKIVYVLDNNMCKTELQQDIHLFDILKLDFRNTYNCSIFCV